MSLLKVAIGEEPVRMTLNEALQIINGSRTQAATRTVFVACGFQPLHLATFFQAHATLRLHSEQVRVQTGFFGDLIGNVDKAAQSDAAAAAVILEWEDLDPRLGLRAGGGWTDGSQRDIEKTCASRLQALRKAIEKLSQLVPVALAPPSLPLPPIGHTTQLQATPFTLGLQEQLASFLVTLAAAGSIRILDPAWLSGNSAADARLEPKMALLAGFPYSMKHADLLANGLVDLLFQLPPKKGLIVDLDDTLWSGIVGEAGVEGVSWSLDNGTQVHAWLQQMLAQLAENGVLLGIVSKNQNEIVQQALSRRDLLVSADAFFPVVADWGSKSVGVREIIRRWNIGADSVVFVDDNPMELSEVQAAEPLITCLRFLPKNPAAIWDLLHQLRNLFGKPQLFAEDRLRSASIRSSLALQEVEQKEASHEFLQTLQGRVTLDYRRDLTDMRPFELINKTNQFNLNGVRLNEGDWRARMKSQTGIAVTVSFEDKFGPLGRIAALIGEKHGHCIQVTSWVMSCRAFSRKIEYHTLDSLFRITGANELKFDFLPTDRNQPLQQFFSRIGIDDAVSDHPILRRERFVDSKHDLPHEVSELTK
jgi:FkbH-like protein